MPLGHPYSEAWPSTLNPRQGNRPREVEALTQSQDPDEDPVSDLNLVAASYFTPKAQLDS